MPAGGLGRETRPSRSIQRHFPRADLPGGGILEQDVGNAAAIEVADLRAGLERQIDAAIRRVGGFNEMDGGGAGEIDQLSRGKSAVKERGSNSRGDERRQAAVGDVYRIARAQIGNGVAAKSRLRPAKRVVAATASECLNKQGVDDKYVIADAANRISNSDAVADADVVGHAIAAAEAVVIEIEDRAAGEARKVEGIAVGRIEYGDDGVLVDREIEVVLDSAGDRGVKAEGLRRGERTRRRTAVNPLRRKDIQNHRRGRLVIVAGTVVAPRSAGHRVG